MSDEESRELFKLYDEKAEEKFNNWLKDKDVKIF